MSKTMKRILPVIISLTVLLAYFYISAQAPEITRYTSKYNPALSQDENMNAWLTGYLHTHQSKLNQKAPLIDYEIEALKSIDPGAEEQGWWIFDVKLSTEARKRPDKLFKTLPLQNNTHYEYHLILYMNLENDVLRYHNDMTEKTYKEKHFPTTLDYETDPQSSFYDDQNMFLRIRENEDSPWMETPVESDDFTTSSQGHFQEDKRIFSSKNHHEILNTRLS